MAAKTKTGRSAVRTIGRDFREIGTTFAHGDAKTRLSYVVMGLGPLFRGQIVKGTAYLGLEILFFLYLFRFGFHYLSRITTLGTVETTKIHRKTVYGDNSFLILLFGILTIVVIAAFLFVWRMNVRENMLEEAALKQGRALPENRKVLGSLLDRHFDKTLLAVPVLGIFIFTVLPLIFMISMAFTTYSKEGEHLLLFDWDGLNQFMRVLDMNGNIGRQFWHVLGWTIVWAIFATFLNYILGMILAMVINRKETKGKAFWRFCFVLSIAVPQFVTLMIMNIMLQPSGAINVLLQNLGLISEPIPFWTNATIARITIIVINLWVGIPYTLLQVTGILQNIPGELYEAARMDGAGSARIFFKITLPYMLFVTTPYLIASFVGNINNFNIIYLLSGGGPTYVGDTAGQTDLLVTWLYKLTIEKQYYNLGAVIGIMTFVILTIVTLITYRNSSSYKNEEAFM